MLSSFFSFVRESIDLETNKITNLRKLLAETGALPHFKSIYDQYGEVDGDKIATFLIFILPHDSTFVFSNQDFGDTKIAIAELCKVDVEVFADVITLESPYISDAVFFLCDEFKSWQYKKMIYLRQASARLDKIATSPIDLKQKNAVKNVSDAALLSIVLSEKADSIYKQIVQTSKSPQKLREVGKLKIEDASFEKILREITNTN